MYGLFQDLEWIVEEDFDQYISRRFAATRTILPSGHLSHILLVKLIRFCHGRKTFGVGAAFAQTSASIC